jgi:hypothetical protein
MFDMRKNELLSLNDILNDVELLGSQKSQIAKIDYNLSCHNFESEHFEEDDMKDKFIEISVQNLIFKSQQCNVLNLRDVSKIEEHS